MVRGSWEMMEVVKFPPPQIPTKAVRNSPYNNQKQLIQQKRSTKYDYQRPQRLRPSWRTPRAAWITRHRLGKKLSGREHAVGRMNPAAGGAGAALLDGPWAPGGVEGVLPLAHHP